MLLASCSCCAIVISHVSVAIVGVAVVGGSEQRFKVQALVFYAV